MPNEDSDQRERVMQAIFELGKIKLKTFEEAGQRPNCTSSVASKEFFGLKPPFCIN